MALIGEIRKRSGLLAVAIGGALVLFLVSDIFSNQNFSSIFGGDEEQNPTVLKVDGKEIDRQQFDLIVTQSERVRTLNGMTVDDNMRRQLRTEAANQLFNDMAIEPLLDNLGITLADKEYGELLTGAEPHPFVKQYFQQQYSPEVMRRFLQNQYQNDPKYKYAMDEIIRAIKTQVKAEKYNNIVRAGFQATAFDAEVAANKDGNKVTGQIVAANYLTVADSLVDATDREMEAYINAHKEEYEVEASRDLEYLEWIVRPSGRDSNNVKEQVNRLKSDFAKAENDSSYIAKYSDEPFNPVYRSHGSFGGEAEDKLFAAQVGEVVGPIAGDGGYGVYKILGRQEGGKKFYNFDQIVLTMALDSSAVYSKARQIIAEIEGGASFADMARRNSVDPSSANGGKMGWVAKASFIPESVVRFNENNAPGTLGLVRGPAGVHIVRVVAKPSTAMVRVAAVIRKLEISRETRNEYYGIANNFTAEIDTDDELAFAKKASELKMNVKNTTKLAPGAQGWGTLPNAREVVKWAFESKRKQGEISEPFSISNRIVVARIKTIQEKGISKLDLVRDGVRIKVMNEKKAEIIKERFEEALEKNKGKADAVSLALAMGTVAQKIENAQFKQNSILYIGNDYSVQGTILGMKKGEYSKPIVGEQGVYVFFCNDVTPSPETPDIESLVAKTTAKYQTGIEAQIDAVLKDNAGLENLFDKYY